MVAVNTGNAELDKKIGDWLLWDKVTFIVLHSLIRLLMGLTCLHTFPTE